MEKLNEFSFLKAERRGDDEVGQMRVNHRKKSERIKKSLFSNSCWFLRTDILCIIIKEKKSLV